MMLETGKRNDEGKLVYVKVRRGAVKGWVVQRVLCDGSPSNDAWDEPVFAKTHKQALIEAKRLATIS